MISLSEKKVKSELFRKLSPYIFSTVAGAAVSIIFIIIFAFAMYALGAPLYFGEYFSLMAFGCGCMAAGFFCGRIKRRGGLKLGFRCAVIFLGIIAVGAAVSGNFNGTAAIAKILTAVITGCTGGVLGVNRQ